MEKTAGNTLVAFFSATGETKRVAQMVAGAIEAGASQVDLFEIEPVEKYTQADLDWTDSSSRSSLEMKDESSRPAIAAFPGNMDSYGTVFVGFPIWWYVEPRIIDTFIEGCDLAGKTIVPFATSGGSGLGKAPQRMRSMTSGVNMLDGKLLNNMNVEAIRDWIGTLEL